MTPELALAALSFLARCDIKGAEAPTLMQLAEALEKLIDRSNIGNNSKAKHPPRRQD